MKIRSTRHFVNLLATLSLISSLSGCIITPRVEMTERIDFNYHAPAIAQPMNADDTMCAA